MDDWTLVAALVRGDPRGLEGAYRTYADQLYTYCHGLLGTPELAEDAVHDTFVLASQCAHRLPQPEQLRAWLYATARTECLRVLHGRPRPGPPPEPAGEGMTEADPVTGHSRAEVQELVQAAAQSLHRGDRELFELAVRHELPAAEIEVLLGVSAPDVPARLTRVRAQLKQALGALMVARTGTQECPDLARLLDGWDGQLTVPVRRRVLRHVESCQACTDRRHRKLRPALLVSAYAAAPYLPVPELLWSRVELNCFDPGFAPEREAIVLRAGRPHRRTGFPRPPVAHRRRRVAVIGATATAVGLLAAGTGAVIPATTDRQPQPPPAAGARTAPGAPAGASAGTVPPRSAATPTPLPSSAASPSTSAPGPSPEAPTPVRLTVDAGADVDCRVGGLLGYTLEVGATASRRLQTATLFVASGSGQRSFPMAVDGSAASEETDPMTDREFVWWVEVTGGQQAAQTDPVRVTRPC